eukprot:scaffold647_cov70-Phaeocystis_antarctica.AAC.9
MGRAECQPAASPPSCVTVFSSTPDASSSATAAATTDRLGAAVRWSGAHCVLANDATSAKNLELTCASMLVAVPCKCRPTADAAKLRSPDNNRLLPLSVVSIHNCSQDKSSSTKLASLAIQCELAPSGDVLASRHDERSEIAFDRFVTFSRLSTAPASLMKQSARASGVANASSKMCSASNFLETLWRPEALAVRKYCRATATLAGEKRLRFPKTSLPYTSMRSTLSEEIALTSRSVVLVRFESPFSKDLGSRVAKPTEATLSLSCFAQAHAPPSSTASSKVPRSVWSSDTTWESWRAPDPHPTKALALRSVAICAVERKASTGERDGLNARDTDVAWHFDARFKPRLISRLVRHVATFTQSSGADCDRTLPGVAATQVHVETTGSDQRVSEPTGAPNSHGVVRGAMANDEAAAAAWKAHPGGRILRAQPAEFRRIDLDPSAAAPHCCFRWDIQARASLHHWRYARHTCHAALSKGHGVAWLFKAQHARGGAVQHPRRVFHSRPRLGKKAKRSQLRHQCELIGRTVLCERVEIASDARGQAREVDRFVF